MLECFATVGLWSWVAAGMAVTVIAAAFSLGAHIGRQRPCFLSDDAILQEAILLTHRRAADVGFNAIKGSDNSKFHTWNNATEALRECLQ